MAGGDFILVICDVFMPFLMTGLVEIFHTIQPSNVRFAVEGSRDELHSFFLLYSKCANYANVNMHYIQLMLIRVCFCALCSCLTIHCY